MVLQCLFILSGFIRTVLFGAYTNPCKLNNSITFMCFLKVLTHVNEPSVLQEPNVLKNVLLRVGVAPSNTSAYVTDVVVTVV